MTATSQAVLNWLHAVLSGNGYRDVQRTYSDITYSLQRHPTLKLRTNVYTFENGASSLLLNAQGTLPVQFRGTTYGFPISLWVPQDYPWAPPMGFVTPTQDMAIRPGQHISAEGRIYHPYLASWRSDSSNITEMLALLQDAFSKEPPVVAKHSQNAGLPSSTQYHPTPPPVPPLPPEHERYEYFAPQTQTSGDEVNGVGSKPPPRPPKGNVPAPSPAASKYDRPAPLPPQTQSQAADRDPSISVTANGHVPTPLPTRQSSLPQPKNQSTHSVLAGNWQQYQALRAGHIPVPLSPPQSALQPPSKQFTPSTLTSNWQQYHALKGYGSPLPLPPSQRHPPANHTPLPPRPPQHNQPASPQDPGLQPQHTAAMPYSGQQMPRAPQPQPLQQPYDQQYARIPSQGPKMKPPEDLLTSPFDTAMPAPAANIAPPPIPPNPQKDALLSALSKTLTQQIQSTHASNQSAITPLRAQQSALTSTLNSINREISQLEDLDTLLTSNEVILHKAMRDADKVLADAKRRKVPSVDEVLVAPTVVGGQLYQTVAEERAIEDARGVVGKALDKSRIGGGVWAKQTRSLAREEFLKKALTRKISRGIGLVEDGGW